jgi:mRNA deadenylase 3'-5' endonuclease subunit Ccr4
MTADGLDRFGRPYTEDSSASKSLVRIQKYIDDDIPKHLAELASRIENVRKILSQSSGAGENVDLYSRSWTTAAAAASPLSSSCNEDIDDNDGNDSASHFTVAQFNTLAKGLSSGLNNLFPTPFESENDGSYGGFTELSMPDVILDFDRIRKWRLLEVILGGGTTRRKKEVCFPNNEEEKIKAAFDILALEEVDEYYSFFEPILTKFTNYCGVYQPKQYSPCVRFGCYSDGVALLWNQEKFQVIPKCGKDSHSTDTWVDKGSYEGGVEYQNQVYIIVPLQIKGTDNCIVVAVTHLKAKKGVTKGIPNEKIRETQASEIRYRAEQMADQLKVMGWKDVSILILGDFNSEPDSASVKTILEESGDWKFQSAYAYDDDSYTTWKTRKDGTTRRVIDYIFHAGSGVKCKQVLSIPNGEELEKTFLPGLRYPSDHLLIAAKFQFANENGQIDQIPEASNSPFEWLTNFQSLRHLLLPSSIVFASPPPSVGNASSERCLKLNALHVGCGTSTVAESLLCLHEKNIGDGYRLQYGYVVN